MVQPRHTSFSKVTIHTAKCDVCNQLNKSELARCNVCSWSICEQCFQRVAGGDGGANDDDGEESGPEAPGTWRFPGGHIINPGDAGWTVDRIEATTRRDDGGGLRPIPVVDLTEHPEPTIPIVDLTEDDESRIPVIDLTGASEPTIPVIDLTGDSEPIILVIDLTGDSEPTIPIVDLTEHHQWRILVIELTEHPESTNPVVDPMELYEPTDLVVNLVEQPESTIPERAIPKPTDPDIERLQGAANLAMFSQHVWNEATRMADSTSYFSQDVWNQAMSMADATGYFAHFPPRR
ncbi:MAG: hypothetical protein M1823_000465 [Watsoniomyces obsoletus]|nr:MAG: hypothetical protein M1823_000465 [Watsoniomyces obsoletus]